MNRLHTIAAAAFAKSLYNSRHKIEDVIACLAKNCLIGKENEEHRLQYLVDELSSGFRLSVPKSILRKSLKEDSAFELIGRESFKLKQNVESQNIVSNERDYEFELENMKQRLSLYLIENKIDPSTYNDEQLDQILFDLIVNFRTNNNDLQESDQLNFICMKFMHTDYKDFPDLYDDIRSSIIMIKALQYSDDRILDNNINGTKSVHLLFETEIVFDMFGMNGPFNKLEALEFLNLVNSVNNKTKPNTHLFCYISEGVANEIEEYFKTAEVLKGKRIHTINQRTSMKYILDTCKSMADIKIMHQDLINFLSDKNIGVFKTTSDYSHSNYQYNYISDDLIARVSNGKTTYDDLSKKLHRLNDVALLRKDKNNSKSIEDCGILLITRKGTFIKASNIILKSNDYINVPLCVDIDFIWSRYWFKLSAGLLDLNEISSLSFGLKLKSAIFNSTLANIEKETVKIFDQLERETKSDKDLDKHKSAISILSNASREMFNHPDSIIDDPERLKLYSPDFISSNDTRINDMEAENIILKEQIQHLKLEKNSYVKITSDLKSDINSIKWEQSIARLAKLKGSYVRYLIILNLFWCFVIMIFGVSLFVFFHFRENSYLISIIGALPYLDLVIYGILRVFGKMPVGFRSLIDIFYLRVKQGLKHRFCVDEYFELKAKVNQEN